MIPMFIQLYLEKWMLMKIHMKKIELLNIGYGL